ncbi:MAG: DUF3999 family protein [Maribacter sp.]
MKTKILGCLFLLLSTLCFGQLHSYDRKIPLSGITEQWHSVPLTNEIFADVRDNLADIRIYGITENDTLEAPYVLKISNAKGTLSKIDFKLINTSSNQNGFYFTYEVPTAKTLNQIRLDFKNKNFDWKVALEGSQNQQEWFTLLDDYRILSIKNNQTDYAFTHLNFPNAKYRYYRLLVHSNKQPELTGTSLYLDSIIPAEYQKYPVTNFKVTEENKNTIIALDLKSRLPLSYLKLDVSDEIDYYRPIEIQYISDSVKTEKGWRYSYRTLTSGTLTSLEKNEFKFQSTLARRLRVIVRNFDNEPLTFSTAEIKGYAHHLVARFTKRANYYLAYGNQSVSSPIYDISNNGFKLPKNTSILKLGQTEIIPKTKGIQVTPLFENKWWLWSLMGIIILVLGGFTLKMMQDKG